MKYLTKSCMHCANVEIHQIDIINRKFKCHITGEEIINFSNLCDDFKVNKQAQLMLKHTPGAKLLTLKEIEELSEQ